jgi:hypothetical protein
VINTFLNQNKSAPKNFIGFLDFLNIFLNFQKKIKKKSTKKIKAKVVDKQFFECFTRELVELQGYTLYFLVRIAIGQILIPRTAPLCTTLDTYPI